MLKKLVIVAVAAVLGLANVGSAKAQFMDMSHMVQAELAFQKQFYAWSWQQSLALAKHLRETGQPMPFNATTLNHANLQNQKAFESYLRSVQHNSNKSSAAISNWTTGAIRGQGPYYSPSNGQMYQLPWTHNVYHINQYGQYVPGYSPYYHNVYPYYGK
ncbi:MAG: hypothetical protein FJ303_17515 [Planctomycetes bacterium]|nr:hypothetical protein [Planctomycetota bacterium]